MWSRTKKKHGNKVAGPSRDSPLNFKQHFFDVPTKSEVTRPSADCQITVFRRIEQLEEFLKKVAERSRDSGHWSDVTRPLADCQTTFFGRFKQLWKILKKVTEGSRDSGRRSRDRRPTVKQRFWTFQAILKIFVKSHWTVTRQWSEVTRPSADCQTAFFRRFKQLGTIL